MKVTLIDYTGAGHPDPWYAARKLIVAKNTRLAKDRDFSAEVQEMDADRLTTELSAVANTIRSSWEFVSYTFKVEAISRATCDQMTRSRVGVAFAVMAQRVVDHGHFDYVIPDTVLEAGLREAFEQQMGALADFYQYLTRKGIPAQDARAVLPMATYSPLTAEYNLRSLAGIVAKRENLRAQGEYAAVAAEMKRLVLAQHPWTRAFLMPEHTQTPALDGLLKGMLGTGSPVDNPQLNNALKELDGLKGTWE